MYWLKRPQTASVPTTALGAGVGAGVGAVKGPMYELPGHDPSLKTKDHDEEGKDAADEAV